MMGPDFDAALDASADAYMRRYWGAGPSGTVNLYMEVPIPLVGDPSEGWSEHRVQVELDEGDVVSARAVTECLRMGREIDIAPFDVPLDRADVERARELLLEELA